ncbi:MAG TPA: nitrilase-related carbon-nitrogen hydrolase [Kofleriaceae bacterium]|nr:nitrilase-related carbon-nitrogen hydrolase [Kofleriaceae bacterium]
MASVANRLAAGALAVALTAVLVWFGTGMEPWWPLLWLAPLPVLLFAQQASWWAAALAAALAWQLGLLNLWHYMHGVLHIPISIIANIFTIEIAIFTLAVLLFRALARRGGAIAAVVAFAATRVAYEYLLDLVSPHGTAGSLAYSQIDFLPFLQLASVTGPWGMTFLVMLCPAALAIAWRLRGARPRALRTLAVSFGALAAVLVFGAVRLAISSGPTVTVGLVASDPPTSPQIAPEGPPTATLFDAYARAAADLAARGAEAIVLPEKVGVLVDAQGSTVQDSDAKLQALADRTHAVIVLGLVHVAAPGTSNEARVYVPGAPVQAYTKHHLIPWFEESKFIPGKTLLTLARPHATWGVAICKDMDFTPLSRAYGAASVGLMLVPAWDFVLDRTAHGHMAILRGVESGFAIVRAAKQGYLTVSDNRGRIRAERTSDAAPFANLLTSVPESHTPTLYLWLGDWFAWLSVALLAGTLVHLVRLRRA